MATNHDWAKDLLKVQALYCTPQKAADMPDDLLSKFYNFRLCFLEEELAELWKADVPEEAVDALIDLIVVAVGTLVVLGVDVHKAWQTVLKANLAKQPGVNPRRPNPFGLPDLIKPEGWKAPDHTGNVGVLERVFAHLYKQTEDLKPC